MIFLLDFDPSAIAAVDTCNASALQGRDAGVRGVLPKDLSAVTPKEHDMNTETVEADLQRHTRRDRLRRF